MVMVLLGKYRSTLFLFPFFFFLDSQQNKSLVPCRRRRRRRHHHRHHHHRPLHPHRQGLALRLVPTS